MLRHCQACPNFDEILGGKIYQKILCENPSSWYRKYITM